MSIPPRGLLRSGACDAKSVLTILVVSGLLGISACKRPDVCVADGDCAVGATCVKAEGRSTGTCACKEDSACDVGEFCNSAQVCQRRTGCRQSSECQASEYCDLLSGSCIPHNAECTETVHCPLGSVCQERVCVAGCYAHGDCPLGAACDRRNLTNAHVLGTCLQGRCDDKAFCEFGQFCVDGFCVPDGHPQRCADCSAADPDRCNADPRILCLINGLYDPSDPESGTPEYCAPPCEGQADCPNGYYCIEVRTLPPGSICANDDDCGGRRCIIGEGEAQGGCACSADSDCNPPSICRTDNRCDRDPSLGCTSDEDCICRDRRCVGNGRLCAGPEDCRLNCYGGSCIVGRACALVEGLTCSDIPR